MVMKMKTTSPSTKHYVVIYFHGFSTSNQITKPIQVRDPDLVPIPSTCISFKFYDRIEMMFEGVLLHSENINHSGMYFIDATLTTAGELKKSYGSSIGNISTMRSDESIVRSRKDDLLWFNPTKDHIYSSKNKSVIPNE